MFCFIYGKTIVVYVFPFNWGEILELLIRIVYFDRFIIYQQSKDFYQLKISVSVQTRR